MPRRLSVLMALVLLAAGAALALAGCGGSEDAGVAPADVGSTEASSDGESQDVADLDSEEAMLAFARCMREHGVNVPDPQPDENGRLRFQIQGRPGDEDKLREAQEACGQYLEAARPELTEEEQAERYDQALAFARCMRDEGIDFPDPQPDGFGPGGGGGANGPPEFDADEPAFQEALETCQDKLGEFGGPILQRRER